MKKKVTLALLLILLPSLAFGLSGNLLKFTRPSTSNIVKTYPASGASPAGGLAFTSSSVISMVGTAAQVGMLMYTGGLGGVASSVIGGLFSAGVNLADAYNRGFFNDGALGDVANQAFTGAPENLGGVKIQCNPAYAACTSGKVAVLTFTQTTQVGGWNDAYKQVGIAYATGFPKWTIANYLVLRNFRKSGLYWIYDQDEYAYIYINGVPDSFGRPESIAESSPQEQSLAKKLAEALGLPEVQTALKNAIKTAPELLKDVPAPITNNQVNEYITNNNTYNDDYISYLNDLKNTYQGDSTWIDQEIARAQKEQAKEELDNAEKESATAPALTIPEIKTVNIQPILDLTGELSGVFPFGLISSFVSGMSSLVAEPTPPSLHIDCGIFQKDIDFSVFNSFASFLRGVMSFLLYGLTAFFCVRLFARM